jgi:aryl-alcohol dehydrogenase-like predicted oxidoreductase
MRSVELAPGIRSSVLGFGCAPVLGAIGAEKAAIAIHTSLDAGVTHFDVARSYGYGEAERFVGRQLKGERDRLVIVTKFGITATAAARVLGPLKPVFRALRGRQAPAVNDGMAQSAKSRLGDLFHRHLPMTPATMRSSLEKSLRALGTDRVDFLLMHEPAELTRLPELQACAIDLKREGKIRGWGLATLAEAVAPDSFSNQLNLLQTNVPVDPSQYSRLRITQGDVGLVLFSALRGVAALDRTARLQRLWADFPRAVVLCSMFTPEHIRSNAAAAS